MKGVFILLACAAFCICGNAQSQQPASTNRLKSTTFKPTSALLDPARPNDCNSLLKDGVFDEHDIFGSSFQVAIFLNRFCSAHYSTYQQASSDGVNIGLPVDGFMASLGFSDAQQNFSQDYQTICSQQDSFAQSNKINNEVIRVADANLAHEFTQCVQGQVFSAYLEPTDGKQFQIMADFHPPGQGDACKVTSLTYDKSQVSCDKPPKTIGPEGMVLNCTRNDEKTAVQLALNTSQGKEGFRLQPYTAPPNIPSGDALFNYLPVGSILALAKLPTILPAGWFLCDGNNGTVDLLDRMPLGSAAGKVVVGQQNGPRGTDTGPTTGAAALSNAWVPGWAQSFPVGGNHTHPLPVGRVYFVQRVN